MSGGFLFDSAPEAITSHHRFLEKIASVLADLLFWFLLLVFAVALLFVLWWFQVTPEHARSALQAYGQLTIAAIGVSALSLAVALIRIGRKAWRKHLAAKTMELM